MDQSSEKWKRNRSILSCTHCRQSKSKCDHEQPCSHCVKKGRAELCSYPAPASRKKPVANLQKRLKVLESMVKNMIDEDFGANTVTLQSLSEPGGKSSRTSTQDEPKETQDRVSSSAQIVNDGSNSRYIGSTHWSSILENIEGIKQYFDEMEEDEESQDDALLSSLTIPFQITNSSSMIDLLVLLPPRSVVDRLILRFFNSNSPSLYIIHTPTFQKQYLRFWADTETTSARWLGLLFSLMTLASLSILAVGEQHPDNRGTAQEILQLYRSCCLQSLALSDILKPGEYTIETLLLHIECEFIWNKGDAVQYYLLTGNTVRLALRMGMHRDPTKIESDITLFQAEMRRRIWNRLIMVDFLSTVHVGLPAMTPPIDSDTLIPRNLDDSDFGEDSTAIPVSRPETELTPVTYAIFKGRLFKVAGKIATLHHKLSTPLYSEIKSLDQDLLHIYLQIPEHFRQPATGLLITDSPDRMIKRLSLALMFQKTRLMLHRKYLNIRDAEAVYSRKITIDTALEILQLQSLLHEAFLPGGPLCCDRWFLSTLSIQDFVMAGMIVYATLARSSGIGGSSTIVDITDNQRTRMLDLLQASYKVWSQTDNLSSEVKKATRLIGKLLSHLGDGAQQASRGMSYAQDSSATDAAETETPLSIFDPNPTIFDNASLSSFDRYQPNLAGSLLSHDKSPLQPVLETELLEENDSNAGFPILDTFDWNAFDNEFLQSQPDSFDSALFNTLDLQPWPTSQR